MNEYLMESLQLMNNLYSALNIYLAAIKILTELLGYSFLFVYSCIENST